MFDKYCLDSSIFLLKIEDKKKGLYFFNNSYFK